MFPQSFPSISVKLGSTHGVRSMQVNQNFLVGTFLWLASSHGRLNQTRMGSNSQQRYSWLSATKSDRFRLRKFLELLACYQTLRITNIHRATVNKRLVGVRLALLGMYNLQIQYQNPHLPFFISLDTEIFPMDIIRRC